MTNFSSTSNNFLANVNSEYNDVLKVANRHCMAYDIDDIYKLEADRRTKTIRAIKQTDGVEAGAYIPTKKLINKLAKKYKLEVEFDDDFLEDDEIHLDE